MIDLERRTAITTASLTQRRRLRRVHPHRVLVVVDEPCPSPGLCASLRELAPREPIEALILAPAHGSAATQWYIDEDAARADATQRLRGCISCLARAGIPAEGRLADPDPISAIADALHDFPAREILMVTAPQRPSTWLHRSVIDRARRSFRQPVTHLVVPPTTDGSPSI